MSDKHHRLILKDDVFALTTKGQNELHGAATSLAPSVLEVLVLIDGKATVDETAARTRTIGGRCRCEYPGQAVSGRID